MIVSDGQKEEIKVEEKVEEPAEEVKVPENADENIEQACLVGIPFGGMIYKVRKFRRH